MIDLLFKATKSANELAEHVGYIAKLTEKLKTKPELAAQKLGQALGEVEKTLQAVNGAMVRFVSLGIDQGALAKSSELLIRIAGDELRTEVERGRGHCHVIGHIYDKYLDKWFKSVFNPEEYTSVETVFGKLGSADYNLFVDLENVAVRLQMEASAVLELIIDGKGARARAQVLAVSRALGPLQKTIFKTMQTLYALQAEYVDIRCAV